MWGCSPLSWPWIKYPSPGALPPISDLFPKGPGEDDCAPRDGREARLAQVEGRQPDRKWDRKQAGVFVLCPMSQAVAGEVVTQGPHRKGLNCQEGAGSASQT